MVQKKFHYQLSGNIEILTKNLFFIYSKSNFLKLSGNIFFDIMKNFLKAIFNKRN